jgi:hypothetical protein
MNKAPKHRRTAAANSLLCLLGSSLWFKFGVQGVPKPGFLMSISSEVADVLMMAEESRMKWCCPYWWPLVASPCLHSDLMLA